MRISPLLLFFCITWSASSSAFSQNSQSADAKSSPSQDAVLSSLQAFPDVDALYRQANIDQAILALQAHLLQHENDPDYFNLLGVLSLRQKSYVSAASAFERVVLMQPGNAGAWMDLAIASAEAGNLTVASAYFDYIETTFTPPPGLLALINSYRQRIARGMKSQKSWQHNAELTAGIDTNANSGLQNSVIPVTLGQERVDLPLDPSFQARRDSFLQVGAGSRYQRRVGQQTLEFGFGARQRNYRTEHAFSNLDVTISAALQRNTRWGDAGLALNAEYYNLGGKGLLHNTRIATSLERLRGDCRIGLSAESEWRRYIAVTSLNANVLWLQAGAACDVMLARVPLQTTLIVRYGNDNPDGARAGGTTERKELIGQAGAPLFRNIRADVSLSLSHAQDQEGYSALLENAARRRIDRHNLRLWLTAPIADGADLSLSVENNRIDSNLMLFQQAGKSISLGLQKRF